MVASEEPIEQAQFPHDFERGGVNGVAAKIAKEVAVLFEHNYIDAGFYFQQAQSFWNNGGGNVSTLGLRLAYSFGL